MPLNIRISPSVSSFKRNLKKKHSILLLLFNPAMCHQ